MYTYMCHQMKKGQPRSQHQIRREYPSDSEGSNTLKDEAFEGDVRS